MRINRSAACAAATFLLASLVSLPSARAGGGERYCHNGQTKIERWPSIPAGGIQWTMVTGPGSAWPAPGYPLRTCTTILEDMPALQSAIRAAKTWNSIPVPGSSSSTPVSTFALSTTPTLMAAPCCLPLTPTTFITTMNRTDRVNVVTLWEPPTSWPAFGGAVALARSQVEVTLSTGVITDCDIAMNTATGNWSFIEENTATGRTHATVRPSEFFSLPLFNTPFLGYVDLQGVLTHEFGHFAGLGHSLVDSVHSGPASLFPALGPVAQGEPFNQTLSIYSPPPGCTISYMTVPSNAGSTAMGGLVAKSARTLKVDDIAAIGDLYPTAAFSSQLGAISGTVYLNNLQTPVPGAHLVAMRVGDPEVTRVSRLAYDNGVFTVNGLPPGTYFLYVEPVDQPPNGASTPGYFFQPKDVPEYVSQGASGCAGVTPFVTEFFNAGGEAFVESSPSTATTITVAAGQTVQGTDLLVVAGTDMLGIRNAGPGSGMSTRFSPRGVEIMPPPGGAGPYPTAELRIQAPITFANQPAALYLASARTAALAGTQLFQLPPSALAVPVTLDASASATIPIPLATGLGYNNVFCQALALNQSNGQFQISNVVSLWVTSP